MRDMVFDLPNLELPRCCKEEHGIPRYGLSMYMTSEEREKET